jgi:hypothetical protein
LSAALPIATRRFVAERLGQRAADLAIGHEHIGRAEFLADVEDRHAARQESRIVEHRPHRHFGHAERNDRRRMAVHDGHDIGTRAVDFRMDEALEEQCLAGFVDVIAIEIEFDNVGRCRQRRRERARHEEMLGICRMPHGDMAERVDDGLIGTNTACGGEVVQHPRIDRFRVFGERGQTAAERQ